MRRHHPVCPAARGCHQGEKARARPCHGVWRRALSPTASYVGAGGGRAQLTTSVDGGPDFCVPSLSPLFPAELLPSLMEATPALGQVLLDGWQVGLWEWPSQDPLLSPAFSHFSSVICINAPHLHPDTFTPSRYRRCTPWSSTCAARCPNSLRRLRSMRPWRQSTCGCATPLPVFAKRYLGALVRRAFIHVHKRAAYFH